MPLALRWDLLLARFDRWRHVLVCMWRYGGQYFDGFDAQRQPVMIGCTCGETFWLFHTRIRGEVTAEQAEQAQQHYFDLLAKNSRGT